MRVIKGDTRSFDNCSYGPWDLFNPPIGGRSLSWLSPYDPAYELIPL